MQPDRYRAIGSLLVLTTCLMPVALRAAEPARPEMARTVVYDRAGVWEASTGTAGDGGRFCDMRSSSHADGHGLEIRFRIGGDGLLFRAHKPGWSIPDGTTMPVVMQIGRNPVWQVSGTGRDNGVEWTLPGGDQPGFDAQFRRAAEMALTFPSGNEPVWLVPLAGSNAISATFSRCIAEVTAQVGAGAQGGTTQPFAAGPTQPNAPPAPAAQPGAVEPGTGAGPGMGAATPGMSPSSPPTQNPPQPSAPPPSSSPAPTLAPQQAPPPAPR